MMVVTIDGQNKRKTEMSAKTASPVFKVNKFNFPIERGNNVENMKIFVSMKAN